MSHPAAVAGASMLGVIPIGEAAFRGANLATFSSPRPVAVQVPKIIYNTHGQALPDPGPGPRLGCPVTSASSPSHVTENVSLRRREMEA